MTIFFIAYLFIGMLLSGVVAYQGVCDKKPTSELMFSLLIIPTWGLFLPIIVAKFIYIVRHDEN